METLDHDGGPVVTVTPDLVDRMADAVDAPTRRAARVLQALLLVAAVAAAVVVVSSDGGVSWWLAVVPLLLVAVLVLADAGRRRTMRRTLAAQDRIAVRYDAAGRMVRFPLAGTEHPVERFLRVRTSGDVLVLERKDRTRTPVPADAIPVDQREALVAALGR